MGSTASSERKLQGYGVFNSGAITFGHMGMMGYDSPSDSESMYTSCRQWLASCRINLESSADCRGPRIEVGQGGSSRLSPPLD